jgi:hypothetical protein
MRLSIVRTYESNTIDKRLCTILYVDLIYCVFTGIMMLVKTERK